MSKYPLDKEALVNEYGDLLIKLALKSYMKEQAQQLEQEDAEDIPAPQPKGNVVAAAFRQVHWEDAKDTVLYGLKKGVTRVAVLFLAVALTFTTAFAASNTVRTSVFQHILNVIRNHTDLLTNTSEMVEQTRYRYDELNALEIPNEQVQEAFDTWVSFRDSACFRKTSSLTVTDLIRMLHYHCIYTGAKIPYSDATNTWVRADALEEFAKWYFEVTPEMLQEKASKVSGCYDVDRGYCDVYNDGIELTPIVDAVLVCLGILSDTLLPLGSIVLAQQGTNAIQILCLKAGIVHADRRFAAPTGSGQTGLPDLPYLGGRDRHPPDAGVLFCCQFPQLLHGVRLLPPPASGNGGIQQLIDTDPKQYGYLVGISLLEGHISFSVFSQTGGKEKVRRLHLDQLRGRQSDSDVFTISFYWEKGNRKAPGMGAFHHVPLRRIAR